MLAGMPLPWVAPAPIGLAAVEVMAHQYNIDIPQCIAALSLDAQQRLVPVQVVKTEITPQLASADGLREAETVPLPYGALLHTRR